MKNLLLAATALMLLCAPADAKGTKKSAKKHTTRKAKPTYYVNGDGTYRTTATDASRPSPYKGDKVPENDGVKKNKERNLNYTSQPVPTR